MSVWRKIVYGPARNTYPLGYKLRLLYYAKHPSFQRSENFPRAPVKMLKNNGKTAKLIFFGDLLNLPEVPKFDKKIVDIFSSADLILGNLEGPLLQNPKENRFLDGWSKQIKPDYLWSVLKELNISPHKLILSVANNHAQDHGDYGLEQTLLELGSRGIAAVGHTKNKVPILHQRRLEKFEIDFKIFAWTHWLDTPKNDFFSDPDQFGILKEKELWDQVPIKKSNEVRIGLPHWDFEYQHFPSAETRRVAQRLASAQFDLVCGAHPHVLQPIEQVENCYVLYSLGNFLQEGHALSSTLSSRLGAIWEVCLGTEGEQKGKICSYDIIPLLHDRENKKVVCLSEAETDAQSLFKKVYGESVTL